MNIAVRPSIHPSIYLSQLSNLQSPESVVLYSSDLVPSEVQDPEVLQTPKHVWGDQVDEVAIEGQLQQLPLAEKRPGLQSWDAIILKVEVMEAAKASQVLKTNLHYSVVLQEYGLRQGKSN